MRNSSRRKYIAAIATGASTGLAGCFSNDGGKLTLDSRPVLGDPDAPVTMVYWSDYQCPFCARFDRETLPRIKSNYTDSGDVRVVLKPIAVFGVDSRRAAHAAHCVWNDSPDSFWEWHHNIGQQTTRDDVDRNTGWANADSLATLTDDISGVNSNVVRTCVENKPHTTKLTTDTDEGKAWGLEGTPHFLMFSETPDSGTRLSGAQPYTRFANALDEQLANST